MVDSSWDNSGLPYPGGARLSVIFDGDRVERIGLE